MSAKEWTTEELEDLAYKREPMPDLRSQAQVLLFLSFRELYQYAAMVGMSQELGRAEKAKILEAYRINKFLEDMQERTNQLWKRIEAASSEYRKSPSIEAADKLLVAIYGVERKVMENGAKEVQG